MNTARVYTPGGQGCTEEGCTEPATAKGLCKAHYMRAWRHGDPALGVQRQRRTGCTVDGCDRPHRAHGYCDTHYRRWQVHGDPGPVDIRAMTSRDGTCRGPECDAPIQAKGLCPGHYFQESHGQDLMPLRRYKPKDGPCEVDHCSRPRASEGLCQTHYTRRLRGEEDWDRIIPVKAPAGSGHTDKHGYRIITVNGRSRREHHVIAEELLGRSLVPTEEVHHRNGQRSDNRSNGPFALNGDGKLISGNLDLWSKAQPAGQEVGPKLDWAAEMIETYGAVWLPTLGDHPRRAALTVWAQELLDLYGPVAAT
jgi:hypothetical protein